MPIRGGACGASMSRRAGRPASTPAKNAASSTLRAMTPTVSRLSASILAPARGMTPKLGLKPIQPQYAAGRITEPAVWVPKPSGTMPRATAAPEPLDEPPGVCTGFFGLAVFPAVKQANSVVTVLPSGIAPAPRASATQAAPAPGGGPA